MSQNLEKLEEDRKTVAKEYVDKMNGRMVELQSERIVETQTKNNFYGNY